MIGPWLGALCRDVAASGGRFAGLQREDGALVARVRMADGRLRSLPADKSDAKADGPLPRPW